MALTQKARPIAAATDSHCYHPTVVCLADAFTLPSLTARLGASSALVAASYGALQRYFRVSFYKISWSAVFILPPHGN